MSAEGPDTKPIDDAPKSFQVQHLRDLLPQTPVPPTSEQEQEIKQKKPSRPPQLFSVGENLLMARLLFVARHYFQLGVTSVIPILTEAFTEYGWFDQHNTTTNADAKKRSQKVNNRVSRINELGSDVLMSWLQFDYPDGLAKKAMLQDIEDFSLEKFQHYGRQKRGTASGVAVHAGNTVEQKLAALQAAAPAAGPGAGAAAASHADSLYVKPKDFGVMSVRRRLKFTEIENKMVRHWLVKYGLNGCIDQLLHKYGQYNLMDDKDATQRVKHIFQKLTAETSGQITAHGGQGSYDATAPDRWCAEEIPPEETDKFERKLLERAHEARGMANQQHQMSSASRAPPQYDPSLEGQPVEAAGVGGPLEHEQYLVNLGDEKNAATEFARAAIGGDEPREPQAKKTRVA